MSNGALHEYNFSRFHEGILFPELPATFRKFRKVSFIIRSTVPIISRSYDFQLEMPFHGPKLPKMTLLVRKQYNKNNRI